MGENTISFRLKGVSHETFHFSHPLGETLVKKTYLSEPHGSGVGIAEAGLRSLVNLKYIHAINLVIDTTISK